MPTNIPSRARHEAPVLLIFLLAFYALSILAMLLAPALPIPEMMALASP